MYVLELNDAELTLSSAGEVLFQEPAVASLAGREPVFGAAALAMARLHPRHTESQYLGRMNADPVTPGAPGIANQADLVYRHLKRLKAAASLSDDEPVAVLVPSASTPEQLSLWLGIAQEARLAVVALIDAAVAAAAVTPLADRAQVVDVALHRAQLTKLVVAETVMREAAEEEVEAGVLRLVEGWVDAVADRFVAETRFDPLRVAATEQQVFDQVYACVANAASRSERELVVETEHRGNVRAVALPWGVLAEKSRQRYERLAQRLSPGTPVLLTERTARLPGLLELLGAAGHEVLSLPAAAARDGARSVAALPAAAAGVSFVTALPRHAAPQPTAAPLGTHLLCGNVAVPLAEAFDARLWPEAAGAAFRIVWRAGGHHVLPNGGAAISVDGRRVDGAVPAALGTTIESGGREFRVVRVIEG